MTEEYVYAWDEEKMITEVETFHIHLQDQTRLFEEGLSRAKDKAIILFGIDEDCHSSKVSEWERSDSSMRVRFVDMAMTGDMMGWNYSMHFEAWCIKCVDEDEDEEMGPYPDLPPEAKASMERLIEKCKKDKDD